MTKRIYTDRSRIIDFQRCPRKRFLTYHQDGTGIVPAKTPVPLAVGSAVHVGLASLLMNYMNPEILGEEQAVAAALAEFNKHRQGLALDAGETAAMAPTPAAIDWQRAVVAQAAELGMDTAQIAASAIDPAVAQGEFDRYLFAEQSALVEGMVRAYARRRLRPLMEQFEVLEVEREGEWKLSDWDGGPHKLDAYGTCVLCGDNQREGSKRMPCDLWEREACPALRRELWFMSRPDALLRERTTNELYLLSYKTTATWDVRKARDIEHDMQGLSEGVEVERRLASWHNICKGMEPLPFGSTQEDWDERYAASLETSTAMVRFLRGLPAPPRIHAIRYEHLLKGERWKDKELSARLGIEVRSQKSPLIRQYVAVSTPKKGDGGYRLGDVCVSWDYYRPEDDRDGSLAWQNWKSRPVWAEGDYDLHHVGIRGTTIRDWIDKLDRSELLMSGEDSTVGLAPRVLGWKSDAQAMGVTKEHPLDAVFIPPVTIWRNDDDLRDWVESVEAQERRTAESVALVHAASDPGERRSLMNIHFGMHRHSCSYPSECPYVKICYAGAEMKNDPLAVGGGMFQRRVPNHPIEAQLIDIKR